MESVDDVSRQKIAPAKSHTFPRNPVQSSPFAACLLLLSPDIRDAHKTNGEASMSETSSAFVSLSADVVAAYVSNNSVPQADLPSLIASVHTALRDAANGKQQAEKVVLEPPVSIKKSITANHLISMEDGRPYKSLKRHLTARGLTPAQYREKWSLPFDYPMVAPNYSKARSELAKASGLGQTRKGKRVGRSARPKRPLRWRKGPVLPGLFRWGWVRRRGSVARRP